MDTTILDHRSFYAVIEMLGEPEELFDKLIDDQIIQMKISQSTNPVVSIYYIDGSYECWHVPQPCKYERLGERSELTESQLREELVYAAVERLKSAGTI